MMNLNEFESYCINQHDIECNQKYADYLPYSFHLKMVVQQHHKFKYLLYKNPNKYSWSDDSSILFRTEAGCWGHDILEDARITYNNIVDKVGVEIAEIIFLCTEYRGRNREERKCDAFYEDMKTNDEAVFVKLCDIIANVKFSLLENSSMFDKAKKEYPKIKGHIYSEKFKPMFDYLEKIFELQ